MKEYVSLRKKDLAQHKQKSYRITVRQLESIVRLSEALARLHLTTKVKPEHVKEAARLLGRSLRNVAERDIEMNADDGSTPVVIPMEIEEPKKDSRRRTTKGKTTKKKAKVTLKSSTLSHTLGFRENHTAS